MDDVLLLVAARRAYELGRVRLALRRAGGAAILGALALYHCLGGQLATPTLTGVTALAALVALFSWRGEGYARGVGTGLAAGIGPLLLPILARWSGLLCTATVCSVLPAAAVVGGLLGGLALGGRAFGGGGDRAGKRPKPGAAYWFSATAVTLTLGSVGCLHAGLAGLAGMALGLLAGSVPAVAVRALRAR